MSRFSIGVLSKILPPITYLIKISVTKEQILAKGKALGPSPYEHSIPKSDLEPLYAKKAIQRRIEGNKRGGSVTSENTSVTKSKALGPSTYNKDVE